MRSMELLATNGQVGISCLGRNAIPNPSKSNLFLRFRPSQGPLLGVVLKLRGSGCVRAVQIEEKEANPVVDRILQKDLSFSPTFGDYLKVLEAIKVERTNQSTSDFDGFNPKRRSSRDLGDVEDKGKSDGGGRDRQQVKDNARVKQRSDNKSNHEKRVGGRMDPRSIGEQRLNGSRSFNRYPVIGRRKDSDLDEGRRMGKRRDSKERIEGADTRRVGKRDDSKLGLGSERASPSHSGNASPNGYSIERRFEPAGRKHTGNIGTRRESSTKRIDANFSRNARDILSERTMSNGDEQRSHYSENMLSIVRQKTTHKEYNSLYEHPSDAVKVGSMSTEVTGKLCKRNAEMGMMDDESINDRAAFKTFEVFTDVRNRPRVLQMEMEERIRNLAKWLNATDVNMPEWQFSRMMHNAKIKFTDHSILRVVQILGEFGNWKRVLQVVEWLQSRERFRSYKSKYIYTAVLDVLGKAKRPMEALNIFYTMRQDKSSYPDLAAYHCIAVTLGQAGLMKELFDVMDCMKTLPKKKINLGLDKKWNPRLEPDLVIYNAVLNACVQKKQWEGAFWVLQQLKQQCIKPSSTTYGLVMEVMLSCEKYNLVHEFFTKMEKTSIPNTLSYRVLVNTLWKEGKIDEAMLAVRDMERRGIVGSASLYYDLARCLCSAGRCQEALMQIDKICKVAKKPLVVTYTGLIQACLDSGNIKDGEYTFDEMRRFCSPNIVTCNIMLKSYLEKGMYDEAKGLFKKMLDDSNCISGKSDLKGKVVPDKYTFNTMIEAASAAGNWDDFEHGFTQMLYHGFHFDKKRHLRMVMDAARAGKEELLDGVWESLVRSARDPPVPIVKERFRMKLKAGDCASMISCLDIQQAEDPHAFSVQSWLNLLKFNAEDLRTDTIVRLIREIRNLRAGNASAQPIYENLLDACVDFLDTMQIQAVHVCN